MPQFPYQFCKNYVFRSPLFPFNQFQTIFSEDKIEDKKFYEICEDPLFLEAVYLASPYLYDEINRWHLSRKELPTKLKNTILKYYGRISNRCTPFGLFSGVGLGQFENDNPTLRGLIRDTKLDMHFLVSLAKSLEKLCGIRDNLLFFPNNSIYKVGNKIRFVEYENNDGKRDYIISSAPLSEELEQILNFSKQGKTLYQIKDILINDAISSEEALEFLEELIDNQVLVSELEPNVEGVDFSESIISVLDKIGAEKERDILISIQNKINGLDSCFGNPASSYSEIEKLIQSLNVDYEQKYLFQTDLYYDTEINLSFHWKKTLKKGISFLNKLTQKNNDTHLEKFKKTFYDRFESEEVSLSFALDTEAGTGYRQDFDTKGVHPYLEDLIIPTSKEKAGLEIKLNTVQIILNQKIQEAISDRKSTIELSDNDFKCFEENWDDLPETMSFMTEIISENNQEILFLNGGSGNAGKLLARFCSEKSKIQELVEEIAMKEEKLSPDQIHAEIIHLPESRIGNILRRPEVRNYEIPYLAKSLLPDEQQITVDDLYISIKNNQVILRSKKHNKEIIPYLTNAHNYSSNSLPIYHFLCDLNMQNTRSSLSFNWGGLAHIYNFLPRVTYENIILSKSQWKVNPEEINHFVSLLNNENKYLLIKEIEDWRKKRQIPKWIQWVESDNTLLVNLENEDLLVMFLSSVKNEKEIIIEEFLYNEHHNFTHQFIFPIYKNFN